jgi:hypothetical protein
MSAGSQRKRPEQRSPDSGSKAEGHDPAFIAVARGQTMRHGIPIPEASPNWLPITRSWYNSLKRSGQSAFYEASDWTTAVCAAQAYDIFLRTFNASTLAVFERLSARLGATISDRKRARIELDEPDPVDDDEVAADQAVIRWQGKLGVVDGVQP